MQQITLEPIPHPGHLLSPNKYFYQINREEDKDQESSLVLNMSHSTEQTPYLSVSYAEKGQKFIEIFHKDKLDVPIQVDCWGCRENQPNQMAHMDPGGCLYCPESFENEYFNRRFEENYFITETVIPLLQKLNINLNDLIELLDNI